MASLGLGGCGAESPGCHHLNSFRGDTRLDLDTIFLICFKCWVYGERGKAELGKLTHRLIFPMKFYLLTLRKREGGLRQGLAGEDGLLCDLRLGGGLF